MGQKPMSMASNGMTLMTNKRDQQTFKERYQNNVARWCDELCDGYERTANYISNGKRMTNDEVLKAYPGLSKL